MDSGFHRSDDFLRDHQEWFQSHFQGMISIAKM